MKRDQFLKELRKLARSTGKDLRIVTNKGKGSYIRVTYDGNTTTVKDGELTPGYVKLLKKQLGIV